MIDLIADLGTSDVCHGWPGAWQYAWRQVAHLGMGAALAITPRPVALAVLAAWLGIAWRIWHWQAQAG